MRRTILKTALLTFPAVLWLCPPALADVTLPKVFGNHMVLQQDKTVPIWGWANPGENVSVDVTGEVAADGTAFKNAPEKTKADKEGKWSVTLGKLPKGAVCKITVRGENTVTLTDVLVGEVWVCSGQSNMEWPMTRAMNAKEEIANAKYPKIRLFHVQRRPAGVPENDVIAEWKVCTPATVKNFSAVAYFFGRHLHKELKVPVGLIATSWGGTRIEPWTPPEGFASVKETKPILLQIKAANERYKQLLNSPQKSKKHQHPLASSGAPTGLYNGMVHGIVPFAIRGAIWYQGESNRRDGLHYEKKMHALINGWRTIWKQGDFPFYFVQLAPYHYGKEDPGVLPLCWEAQTNVLKLKNTGMAVVHDIGNTGNIHPANKQGVGKRLALWALAKDYGRKDLVYSGPLYKSHKIEGDKIRVTFDHIGSGLVARDGKPLNWFEVAGKDGKFVKAMAKVDGDTVVVWSDDVKSPVHVRMGWNKVAEPNLANKEGLPASPFRSNSGK